MISPQSKELLESMSKTQYGKAIQEFLDEELLKLNNVKTIDTFDDALGRKKAVEIIDKLFMFIREKKLDNQEKSRYN